MNVIILLIILNILFFLSAVMYFRTLKKQLREDAAHELEERKLNNQELNQNEHRLKEELAEVKKKSNEILTESQKIAQEMILELEHTLGINGAKANIDIPAGSNFEIELGKLSQKLKSGYVNKIQSLLGTLERFEVHEAQKVQDFAEEQTVTTDENLQKYRVEQLDELHKRLERYKEEEKALFDAKVLEVINMAAMDVLGHAITVQDQAELIGKALEKAKLEKKL